MGLVLGKNWKFKGNFFRPFSAYLCLGLVENFDKKQHNSGASCTSPEQRYPPHRNFYQPLKMFDSYIAGFHPHNSEKGTIFTPKFY